MHGSRPSIGADAPLRGRLERLDGLPLRPSTAALVRADRSGIDSPRPAGASPELSDPGWALARALDVPDPGRGIAALAALPWWRPLDGRDAEARDRLWRFGVATALAARQLAAVGGDPDPDVVACLGLLQPLALWALAAVEPGLLAEWMASDRDADRALLESRWFGGEASAFGAHLARRWGGGPGLADAALLGARAGPVPPGLCHDPVQLEWVRRARAWAMHTPWALPGPPPEPAPTDAQRRWLVASVQARCPGTLAPPIDGPGPEEAIREAIHASILAERAEAERADLSERLHEALRLLDEARAPDARSGPADVLDAMAEFAAGAAHELNNPLAIIAGRAQLLRSRLTEPEHRKDLQTIIGQARRAHQILRDLIYIARPPAPRRVPCVPDQLLRTVVDDLEPEARARSVALSCRRMEGSASVLADPEALKHLAEALIRNALEATPEGGAVVAEALADRPAIVWTIRDEGVGLDQRGAAHLLDPFYCGRQAGRGLGLGLPRVARFVRSIGGTISWHTSERGGTVVRVDLPIAADLGPPGTPGAERTPLRDAG